MNFEKFNLPQELIDYRTNVWLNFDSEPKFDPINLGQGAPDYAAPAILDNSLKNIPKNPPKLPPNTRGFGYPRLMQVLSRLYSPLIDREIDPINELLIANGAIQLLHCAILAFIKMGDEVIIFEPYFDCYEQLIWMSGGIPVYVPLLPNESNEWVIDKDTLIARFNSRTKIIIVNSPHNPTGKIFTRDELDFISQLCEKWNTYCVADDVYEWMIYKPNKFERMVTIPGMWKRTITIGSGGKTFCATGWKIGWAYGPANLIRNLQVPHRNRVFTCRTPLQKAFAIAFEQELQLLDTEQSFFSNMMNTLEKKRDFCVKFLTESGFTPMIPQGGCFMLVNWKELGRKLDITWEVDDYKDITFTKWMTKNTGLILTPSSAFYNYRNKRGGENYIRICFFKNEEVLEKAANILKALTNK